MIGKIFPRKLNKESDPSLIKPDEMMDALNVLASGSEGNDASLVKKAHGNFEAVANDPSNTFDAFSGLPSDEEVVGHVVDESSNRVYYFAKGASSDSVYLAEKFSEDEVKITLLLRDADLGFEDYVAADIIKTPKKTVESVFQDLSFSGVAGDSTSVFDFEADDQSTEIIENQTVVTVSNAPQFFTSPVYDGNSKVFNGQLTLKNLGGEPGEVNLGYSHISGNDDNYVFSYTTSGNESLNVTLEAGAIVIVPFKLTLIADIPVDDATYSISLSVEEVPTPFTQTPLDVSYDRSITLQFVVASTPISVAVEPILVTASGEDGLDIQDALTELFPANDVIGSAKGMLVPESPSSAYLGVMKVTVTLSQSLGDSLSFLSPMSLRCSMLGGTDGNVDGSNQGFYDSVEDAVNGSVSPGAFFLREIFSSDFQGGQTASYIVPFGKNWDSSTGFEGEVIDGSMRFSVINEETALPFTDGFLNSSSAQVDYEYTIANVDSPPVVVVEGGNKNFNINLASRTYKAQSDSQEGGSVESVSFTVRNTGEASGYFNIAVDPLQNVHKELRSISSANGTLVTQGVYNQIDAAFKSLYDSMSIIVSTSDGADQTGKPSFIKSFGDDADDLYGTNGKWDFFEKKDGGIDSTTTAFSWHLDEEDQDFFELSGGQDAQVTLTFDNTSMVTYPQISMPAGGSDVGPSVFSFSGDNGNSSQSGTNLDSRIIYPQGQDYPFNNYNRSASSPARPLFGSDYEIASDLFQSTTSVAASYDDNFVACPLLKSVFNSFFVRTSTDESLDGSIQIFGGVFNLFTDQSQPEILIAATGNFAHPNSRAVAGQITPQVPLINSHLGLDPDQVNPADFSQANSASNYPIGNTVKEFFTVNGDVTTEKVKTNSFSHYGRRNNKPLSFTVFSLGLCTTGSGGSVSITSTPNGFNIYNSDGPHGESVFSFGSLNPSTGGSTGNSFVGAYLDGGEALNGQIGASSYGAFGIGGTNSTNTFSLRDFIRNGNQITVPPLVENNGPYSVFSQRQSGLELLSQDGTSASWGEFRKFSLNMKEGSILYLEPVHMISYSFYEEGQLDSTIDNQDLSETRGMYNSYSIQTSGFSNDTESIDDLCWEQTHLIEDYFNFHGTNVPPSPGEGVFRNVPPPPKANRELPETLVAESSTESSINNSVNLPDDPRDTQAQQKKSKLTKSGLSSKKKRKY